MACNSKLVNCFLLEFSIWSFPAMVDCTSLGPQTAKPWVRGNYSVNMDLCVPIGAQTYIEENISGNSSERHKVSHPFPVKGNSGVLEQWLTPGSQEQGSSQQMLDHHLVPGVREELKMTSGLSPRERDRGFYHHILRHRLGTKISTVRNDKSLSVHASTPIINRQGKKWRRRDRSCSQ